MPGEQTGPFRDWLGRLFELRSGPNGCPSIEGLRGLSAFLVFWVHFYQLFGPHVADPSMKRMLRFVSSLGQCGVDVFFALSGFLIYGYLIDRPFRLTEFVCRRIVRLYPTFTVVFGLYLILNNCFGVKTIPASLPDAFVYLMANFLMLPGVFPIVPLITVAWSLSYELCFYVALPVTLRVLAVPSWRRSARRALTVAVCAGSLALWIRGGGGHPRMVMFGCGILLYQTIGRPVRWSKTANALAVALFALALTLYGFGREDTLTRHVGPIARNPGVHLALLFAGVYALGYVALGDRGVVAKVLRMDGLRWFGNMSYSYYLAHPLALHMARWAWQRTHISRLLTVPGMLGMAVVSLVLSTGAGALLFLGVEKPFSLRRPLKTAPAKAAAASAAGMS